MPPVLVKAHQELDKAVDLCYRPLPFNNAAKRIEFYLNFTKNIRQTFYKEKVKKTVKQK
jgi:hypothetical protein